MKLIRQVAQQIAVRIRPIRRGSPHGLPRRLVVSLTSHAPRFPTLHLTLLGLLNQDLAPDAVILWLARTDIDALPPAVTRLKAHGLTIAECEDVRQYNKLVPALNAEPDAFIVTADDDIYYPRGWLRRFAEEYQTPSEILCQRARSMEFTPNGLGPYKSWRYFKQPATGECVFPTGFAGIMYPPGSLPLETVDSKTFLRLCPHADDIWLYWMAKKAGRTHRVIKPAGKFTPWRGSQVVSLWRSNIENGGNDIQMSAMFAEYGLQPLGRT